MGSLEEIPELTPEQKEKAIVREHWQRHKKYEAWRIGVLRKSGASEDRIWRIKCRMFERAELQAFNLRVI